MKRKGQLTKYIMKMIKCHILWLLLYPIKRSAYGRSKYYHYREKYEFIRNMLYLGITINQKNVESISVEKTRTRNMDDLKYQTIEQRLEILENLSDGYGAAIAGIRKILKNK